VEDNIVEEEGEGEGGYEQELWVGEGCPALDLLEASPTLDIEEDSENEAAWGCVRARSG
jgi:hypothetical protein